MINKINVRLLRSQRATEQYVDLDGIRVGLRCQFSNAESRWYLWLLDTAGTVFAGPIRLVRGLSLLRPYQYDSRVPPGQLFVSGEEMDADNVDRTAVLLYRPLAQVASS